MQNQRRWLPRWQRIELVEKCLSEQMTRRQAAAWRRVSPSTVQYWIERHRKASDSERRTGSWAEDRPSTPKRQPRLTSPAVHDRVCEERRRTGWRAAGSHGTGMEATTAVSAVPTIIPPNAPTLFARRVRNPSRNTDADTRGRPNFGSSRGSSSRVRRLGSTTISNAGSPLTARLSTAGRRTPSCSRSGPRA